MCYRLDVTLASQLQRHSSELARLNNHQSTKENHVRDLYQGTG
jgi:hypothetical protein